MGAPAMENDGSPARERDEVSFPAAHTGLS
jgi:hypothetical protein